ncbi:hypothetical protein KRI00_35955 [Paraburkholderia fungorum]|nr:hypothetical protein [Paraburkholderia fungorum]MBU7442654.1 hypothetical protein [Paraburkholderia fungorum]
MTDESKFPPEVLERFRREQEESDAHFTTAPARFFEAWKQAALLAGPVYFGDGTREAIEKAKDKWALAPNGAVILDAFGVLSSGERTFLAALYSFYNSDDSVPLWEKAGIRGFADLSGLDLVRRKLIAELLLNYVGW